MKNTSFEALKGISESGQMDSLRERFRQTFENYSEEPDGMTAEECISRTIPNWRINIACNTGRFTELERCKKIRKVCERPCRVTGGLSDAFVATPQSQWIKDPGSASALVPRTKIWALLDFLKSTPGAETLLEAFKEHA